jgi:hypothetical protein
MDVEEGMSQCMSQCIRDKANIYEGPEMRYRDKITPPHRHPPVTLLHSIIYHHHEKCTITRAPARTIVQVVVQVVQASTNPPTLYHLSSIITTRNARLDVCPRDVVRKFSFHWDGDPFYEGELPSCSGRGEVLF